MNNGQISLNYINYNLRKQIYQKLQRTNFHLQVDGGGNKGDGHDDDGDENDGRVGGGNNDSCYSFKPQETKMLEYIHENLEMDSFLRICN